MSQLKFCQRALALSEHTCIKINADSWLSMLHTLNDNGSSIGFIEFVFFPQAETRCEQARQHTNML